MPIPVASKFLLSRSGAAQVENRNLYFWGFLPPVLKVSTH